MLNWGLIGAGGIARVFANGMRFSKTGRIVAVASQTAGKAEQLAGDFGIPKSYSSYEALLADAEVQAVYISTIHPFHAACAIQATEAGKHILVEGTGHYVHMDKPQALIVPVVEMIKQVKEKKGSLL